MGGVRPPIFARAGEWDALLVASELDEFAELLLSKHLQGSPEELNVLVSLHQTYLVHGVSLQSDKGRVYKNHTNYSHPLNVSNLLYKIHNL